MQTIIEHNLLKYAAGHHIFCPVCKDKVLDWKDTVIVERADGSTLGVCCGACYDGAMGANAPLDKYKVIRHGKPAKSPRIKREGFPATKGALNTALRRDIFASFKRQGYTAKTDRVFPAEAYGNRVDLIDTATCDGFDSCYAEPIYSSLEQSRDYAAEYCRLNHLTLERV